MSGLGKRTSWAFCIAQHFSHPIQPRSSAVLLIKKWTRADADALVLPDALHHAFAEASYCLSGPVRSWVCIALFRFAGVVGCVILDDLDVAARFEGDGALGIFRSLSGVFRGNSRIAT